MFTLGLKNSGIWSIVINNCIDEDFKAAPVSFGGNNEPCFLTTRSVGSETSKCCTRPKQTWWTAEVKNQEFWLWHLRSNVFRILVTRQDPNLGRKSMCVLYKYINRLRHIWFRFYHLRKWGIYRVRWLLRWWGLHYPATWAKRFCKAKFKNNNNKNNNSEIFHCAEPRNGTWYFPHQVSAEAIHMLDGLFRRDWRHSYNKSPWHCFEVTITSDFKKQSSNSHYYVSVNLSGYNSN